MYHVKYLIVGGGISGLSFATFINDDDYLIIEKETEVGGYCRTINKEGFIWDYAGHFFHFSDENLKDFFLSKIDSKDIVFSIKKTKIFYNGIFIDYPFQKNIHQLEKSEFIDCIYDLFIKSDTNNIANFKDMLHSTFGKSICNKFLVPYNEKLYACDLKILDNNAMGRFFPNADVKSIIRNFKISDNISYNHMFMYPKKGAMTFINVLLNSIDSNNLKLNETLISIDINNKIAITNNNTIKYQYLINTVPFNDLLNMCKLGFSTEDFSHNKVIVLNMGFDSKGPLDIHWIYIPNKDYNFYRVGFYDNILNTDKMSLYVEIGKGSKEYIDLDNELCITLNNLKKINVVTNQKLIASEKIVMNPAYVHITKKSKSLLNNYMSILNKVGIYTIGRYGGWKYCSMEDCIIDGKNLAAEFNYLYK